MSQGTGTSVVKTGFLDLAAAFFVIGGVISLIVSVLALPIFSVYPFIVVAFGLVLAVIFVVGLICSLVAIHCYNLTTRRSLSQAGMRGIISGAILLTLSLGLIGMTHELTTQIGAVSAIMILIAGAVCFVLR
ncbi:MAG: hypothetical protein ABSC50_00100 [Candidatus Bathyarchaeia archaeon]